MFAILESFFVEYGYAAVFFRFGYLRLRRADS